MYLPEEAQCLARPSMDAIAGQAWLAAQSGGDTASLEGHHSIISTKKMRSSSIFIFLEVIFHFFKKNLEVVFHFLFDVLFLVGSK